MIVQLDLMLVAPLEIVEKKKIGKLFRAKFLNVRKKLYNFSIFYSTKPSCRAKKEQQMFASEKMK